MTTARGRGGAAAALRPPRTTGRPRVPGLLLAVALCLASLGPAPAQAQQPPTQDTSLQRSRERLAEIRLERERLQADMERLRGRVHSLFSELANIERQAETTRRVVSELDLQINALGSQIERITADLIVAEDALAEKRAILDHRISEIAKRGPLFAAQVLLAAESFGDLLSRYKYLYLVSRQDRQLVRTVTALRDRVAEQRNDLLNVRTDLARRRNERSVENERIRQIERQRERSLRESQADQRQLEQRIRQLARDESRLNDVIGSLERRRLAAVAAGTATAPSRISTADLGQLDWPVTGDIIYRFGRQQLANNTTIRRNGIGIATPSGTPVRAIAAGTVSIALQLGTYGESVVLDHGGGFYSIYAHLSDIGVRRGQSVERGAVLGRSGGENSDEGPHLYFEIRGQNGQALDPIEWLRRRR
jgi:murein hydrolase activator